MPEKKKLKILLVSAEVAPFAKTGGLADVAGSLPQALIAKGHDVIIVMPRYKKVIEELEYVTDFPVVLDWRKETCIIKKSSINFKVKSIKKDVIVYFVDNYHYFDREHMYCYFDEAERFAFFDKAVLEMLPIIDFKPDVIHCNDWQSGPISMLLKEKYSDKPFYSKISTLYTIHNLQYQGNYPKDTLKYFNLEESYFSPEKLEFYGTISFTKAGLNYVDIINTVSDVYAQEIQTEEYGEKFEGLLKQRSKDLYGVVNGISYHEFDPYTDSRIFKNYDVKTISGKKDNKIELQKEMGLPINNFPVIGLISRLVNQKGLDLIEDAIEEIMKKDMQFILLGAGDEYYESFFKNLKSKYPEKFSAYIGFNTELAQRIYAGSDFFLMPSKFEPCGLGQLISLRYGTIPIVCATGGLADTIKDFDPMSKEGNGFSFQKYSSKELIKTITRAIDFYKNDPKDWLKLVIKAMKEDFSWDRSAEKYIEIYHKAIEKNTSLPIKKTK